MRKIHFSMQVTMLDGNTGEKPRKLIFKNHLAKPLLNTLQKEQSFSSILVWQHIGTAYLTLNTKFVLRTLAKKLKYFLFQAMIRWSIQILSLEIKWKSGLNRYRILPTGMPTPTLDWTARWQKQNPSLATGREKVA